MSHPRGTSIPDKVVDEIIIDSAFSPVRLVNYYVENTRVGQDTDYDRLILEVTTDGRITPVEALTFATQIGFFTFKYSTSQRSIRSPLTTAMMQIKQIAMNLWQNSLSRSMKLSFQCALQIA